LSGQYWRQSWIDKESKIYWFIEGYNYFKLRDIAYVLNQTKKRFAVGWDAQQNAISLTSGAEYIPQGTEMARGNGTAKMPSFTSSRVYLDGKEIKLTAYNIGGSNYFKLRDMGDSLGFVVRWDDAEKVIRIETGEEED